jgi:heat shock protein HslJ
MARTPRLRAAAIALVLMASAGRVSAENPAGTQLAGTTWRAETIMGRAVIDASTSTITFEADGRIHGRGGCNRYFGTSSIAGERLSFGAMGSTRMACPGPLMEQETRFFQALERAERWSLDEQGLLLIYSSGAEAPSRFASFAD